MDDICDIVWMSKVTLYGCHHLDSMDVKGDIVRMSSLGYYK